MFKIFLLFFAISHSITTSFAGDTPEETLLMIKKVTPSFQTEKLYGAMAKAPANPTNNLRRASGSPFFAKGVPLAIEGRVFDVTGKPISDVRVQIVQANYFGSYNFLVDKDSAVHDQHFLSSGTSVTNNLGEYSFLTIMPGYYGNRAPHLHVTIIHRDFEFETEMFFANHPRNDIDAKYLLLSSEQRSAVTGKMYYKDEKNFNLGMKAVFDIYINYSI